jgi:signal peptidase II
LPVGHSEPVISGYWDWQLSFNPGAAFSTLGGARVLLSLLAIGALVGIAIATARSQPEQRLKRIAYAVISGGAAGNLVDRLWSGEVTDFVHWHVHEHSYPVFNVADVALWVGVGLLIIEGLRRRSSARAPAAV